ncbi:PhzF family phenazine biosynthesis protein [Maribacter sp. HTCC2170]|uniref:PhzF family phenazine biosynthesis protein n=1 Tax=Maribacter sp. (strain HTCC2170 / KCCM 42371) TaxID=313603 RepID=UPI00006BD3DF|nr:PhzF family phenazine biosynthesis protein [Maribacter sp. HTCC2170]EAR02655.1 predicted epimerase PhzC/PhzF-like protein [Maribacter sp. HTCC2170]
MKLKIYQIDAFTDKVFSGNPAAVCVLNAWLDTELMQKIAAENNLAETAFIVKNKNRYEIRWFTPEIEVDLCGHATLASAYVLFNRFIPKTTHIDFYSERSGALAVQKEDDGSFTMDFPTDELIEVKSVSKINEALNISPRITFKGKTDYLVICKNQAEVERIVPNYFILDQVDARGVIVTAQGREVDFVSRFFAPLCGIPEDPVTGSAHTSLTPYWSKVLGKDKLFAKQLSKRGGDLVCENRGNRVSISGKAVAYLEGEIEV